MVRINLVAVWVLALGLVAYAEPPSQSYGAPAAAQPVFRQASAPQSQYGAPQQQQYSAPAPQQAPQQYSAPAPAPQSSYGSPAPQQHHAPAPQQYNAPEEQAPQEGGKIHKHVYVHVAPDEEPEFRAQRPKKPAPAPEKHYKILFIKAPSASPGGDEEIQLPPAPETKTLVYVLLKKPEFAGGINFATPAPTQPSKPEVYFIRYKGGNKDQGNQGGYNAPAPQEAPQQYNAPAPQQAPQQYNAPAPQQYNAPAPQQAPQQYNAPAPQSSYGSPAPKQYSAPAPQPQQYSAPAPQQYNAPAPQQAPQQYNGPTPQSSYGSPAPQQYHAPAPQQAPQQYNAPAPQRQQQSQQYGAPEFSRHARHSQGYFGHRQYRYSTL